MSRRSNQVSLEPYGYKLVRRAPKPILNSKNMSRAAEPKGIPTYPLPQTETPVVTPPLGDPLSTQKRGNSAGWASAVIIGVLLFVVLLAMANSAGAPKDATYLDSGYDAGMACVMAEKMIKPQLKAPTSAEFDYGDCKSHATHSGNT